MLEYNNMLSVKEYCELRSSVEWQPIIEEQAQAGLNNSDFIIACRDGTMRVMVQVCKYGGFDKY